MILPIYFREEDTNNCLDSLGKTGIQGLSLSIVLAVNGTTESQLTQIKERVSSKGLIPGASTKITMFPGNPGKGVSVNKVVEEESKVNKFDFILSLDSDMVVTDSNWLVNLISDFHIASKYHNLGALACDQSGQCCHVPDSPVTYSYKGRDFVGSRKNQGQAGGCLLIKAEVWYLLKGYRAFRVYGSDDGHLMADMSTKGLVCLIAKGVSLYHPFQKNMEYCDWKKRACIDALSDKEKGGFFK
jgi:hypothetical protein